MLEKITRVTIFLMTFILISIAFLYLTKTPNNTLNIEDPFFGDSEVMPLFNGYEKGSTYIILSDSTQIAIDYFVPTDGPDTKSFPVIFEYTPYGRSYILPEMPLWQRVYSKIKTGFSGPIYDRAFSLATRVFLSQGYAYVVADMRGSGASSGSQMPLLPKLGEDGKEIIAWINKQPWSDGQVGMTGQSFVGWSQFITASNQPPGLKCLAPSCIMFETYSEGSRPGGISSYRWLQGYSDLLYGVNRNKYDPKNTMWKFLPTTPVIDEDNDGELSDEIPMRSKGDPTMFYDDLPFTYADGNVRKDIYANNTLQHLNNFLAEELIGNKAQYIDSKLSFSGDSIRFSDTSPGSFIKAMAESGIAVYNLGGWFDGFTKGTTKLYANLEGKTADYLMIAPRFHRPMWVTSSYQEFLDYQGNFTHQLILEQLKFYNKHLQNKKVDTFDQPVKIYTFNKGWQKFDTWPPNDLTSKLYFTGQQKLAEKMPEPGTTSYSVDYSANSNYGSNHWNRWLLWNSPDMVMKRGQADSLAVVFETDPLAADLQVTGHPIVEVYLSSTQTDADVFVYLSDVDTDGTVYYVTEGQLRSDWHNLVEATEQVLDATNIKPELPWHGYKQLDADLQALDSGRVIKMRFDLMPTSWVFKQGHKLRVSLTGADKGNFMLHPALSANNNPDECPATTWTIYSTVKYPSMIELPIISTQ